MIQRNSAIFFGGALLTLAIACGASAQEKAQTTAAPKRDGEVRIERHNVVIQTPDGPVTTTIPELPIGSARGGKQEPLVFREGFADLSLAYAGAYAGGTFDFVSTEMSFSGKVVKGAPYSATGVTERTQTLGDGNRIVNKSASQLYRDSEGRTRREQTIHFIGNFMAANASESSRISFINDPVAGFNYILDEKERTARKIARPNFNGSFDQTLEALSKIKGFSAYPPLAKAGGIEGFVPVKVTINDAGEVISAVATDGPPLLRQAAVDGARKWVFNANQRRAIKNNETVIGFTFTLGNTQTATRVLPTPVTPYQVVIWGGDSMRPANPPNTKTESLGKQIIEGIEAEGTRTTTTIPAGKIGNERDIDIISERWYSTELQTLVMSKQDDPRTGTNVYRLTNITRDEPARSLFEVPADYTIKANEPNILRSLRMKKDE